MPSLRLLPEANTLLRKPNTHSKETEPKSHSVKSVVPVVIPFRCVPRSSLILRSKREAHQNDLWIGSVVFVALAAGSTRQMCRRESLRAQQSTLKFLCSMRSCVAQWNAALLTRLYIC